MEERGREYPEVEEREEEEDTPACLGGEGRMREGGRKGRREGRREGREGGEEGRGGRRGGREERAGSEKMIKNSRGPGGRANLMFPD